MLKEHFGWIWIHTDCFWPASVDIAEVGHFNHRYATHMYSHCETPLLHSCPTLGIKVLSTAAVLRGTRGSGLSCTLLWKTLPSRFPHSVQPGPLLSKVWATNSCVCFILQPLPTSGIPWKCYFYNFLFMLSLLNLINILILKSNKPCNKWNNSKLCWGKAISLLSIPNPAHTVFKIIFKNCNIIKPFLIKLFT